MDIILRLDRMIAALGEIRDSIHSPESVDSISQRIMRLVADRLRIRPTDILGRKRYPEYTWGRILVVQLLQEVGWGRESAIRYIGRQHSKVYSDAHFQDLIRLEPAKKVDYMHCQARILCHESTLSLPALKQGLGTP